MVTHVNTSTGLAPGYNPNVYMGATPAQGYKPPAPPTVMTPAQGYNPGYMGAPPQYDNPVYDDSLTFGKEQKF